MLNTLFYISTNSWEDYFGSEKCSNKLQGNSYQMHYEPLKGNIYITHCNFGKFEYPGSGSIVKTYLDILMIEYTTFIDCKTIQQNDKDRGGAIYFCNINNGKCVIQKTCSYSCYCYYNSFSYGQFCHIIVKDQSENRNNIFDSSFTKTEPTYGKPSNTLDLLNGKIEIMRCNVSFNSISYYPTVTFIKNTANSIVGMSHFSNNTAREGGLYFGENHQMKMVNFIGNNINKEHYLITIKGSATITKACFIGNKAKDLFKSSEVSTLTSCVLDGLKNKENLLIKEYTTYSFINAIPILNTKLCPADPKLYYYKKELKKCNSNINYLRKFYQYVSII